MALQSNLLEILVCPEDKQPLWYFADDGFLYNPRLKRRYDIKDNIPILLVHEASDVADADASELEKRFEAGGVRATGEPSS